MINKKAPINFNYDLTISAIRAQCNNLYLTEDHKQMIITQQPQKLKKEISTHLESVEFQKNALYLIIMS